MAKDPYDAIVVGARCAGSPTAMLLARAGYKVLLVDRATFPSDTVSTHLLHPPGVATLARWGLLERLVATACPPIDTYRFDFGPFTLSGSPGTEDTPVAYGPRRTVLDKLLLDAAAEAGAAVREGFTVTDVVVDGGRVTGVRGHSRHGRPVTEAARVVVGADGRHSLVARAVQPEQYREKPPLLAAYYSYWSGLPMDGRFEDYVRPDRGFAAWPTHDDLTLVIGGWPYPDHEANRADVEKVLARMAAEMRAAAKQLEFERAAALRDEIQQVRLRVLEQDASVVVGRAAERAAASSGGGLLAAAERARGRRADDARAAAPAMEVTSVAVLPAEEEPAATLDGEPSGDEGTVSDWLPGIRDEHEDEGGWQARWLERQTWDHTVTPNVIRRTGTRPPRPGRRRR